MKYQCPVCGGDRDKNMAEAKSLVRESGFTGEVVDPGGRVLYFGTRHLRLQDQCNACDEKTIMKFLSGAAFL
jgi:hypothetical protein